MEKQEFLDLNYYCTKIAKFQQNKVIFNKLNLNKPQNITKEHTNNSGNITTMEEYSIFFAPNDSIMEEEEFERLYAAPVEVIVLLSIFYGSISIVTIIGNTLVIWVVATTRQMRTVTNMYIANLAFADVIIGLFCIPFQFQAALLQRWNLPWFMCGFCPFVQALSVNVSVFTLTAIAIDRHRAIINPLRARPTTFASKFIIASIWFVSFVFAIPCAIAFRVELVEERFKENEIISNVTRPFCTNVNLSESQLLSYRYSLVFVQYLVPFCVISFVYIQMAIKLWGTHAPGNAQDSRDLTLLKNKKKVIKMLIIVVIVFGLCWLPLQLYNILYVTIPEINEYHFINIVWFCCDWLAMSNSCYNPFIYGIYNEKFKREFNKRFAVCFCRFRTSLDAHERTMSMPTRGSSMRTSYITTSLALPNSKGASHSPAILYSKRDLKRIPSLKINDDYNKNHNLHNYSATVRRSCAALGVAGTVNGEGTTTFLSTLNPPASTLIESNATLNNNHHYCSANGGSVSLDDSHRNDALQWQRNNFKPLHLELIECDGDENDEDATTTIVEDFLVMHKSKKNTASNVFKSSENNHNSQNIDSLEEQPLKLNKSLQNINEPSKITSSINSKTHGNCNYVSNYKQRIGNVSYDNDADVEKDDDDADIHNIENCIYTVAPQKDCTETTANAVNDVAAVDVAYPSISLQPSEYTSLLSRSKNQTKSIT